MNASPTPSLLALLSDFGLQDPYLAQLKGVVCTYCPQVQIVDICHELPPFALRTAAFFLSASAAYFPPRTVFLAIVDPGVGSARDVLILERGGQQFVAPNNGLLGLLLKGKPDAPARLWRLPAPALPQGSLVFAGRDIMAPAVGRLLAGAAPSDLGEPMPLNELSVWNWACPEVKDREIRAEILHVDRFGNLILNISDEFRPFASVGLRLRYLDLEYPLFLADFYAQLPPRALGLIPGSQGYLEIALNCASAADFLGLAGRGAGQLPAPDSRLQLSILW